MLQRKQKMSDERERGGKQCEKCLNLETKQLK